MITPSLRTLQLGGSSCLDIFTCSCWTWVLHFHRQKNSAAADPSSANLLPACVPNGIGVFGQVISVRSVSQAPDPLGFAPSPCSGPALDSRRDISQELQAARPVTWRGSGDLPQLFNVASDSEPLSLPCRQNPMCRRGSARPVVCPASRA